MPKKTPKNAFFYFMVDFRNEQKQKGVLYDDMKAVAVAADPEWKKLPDNIKSKYQNIAKKTTLDQKFTSFGQSLADLERIKKEETSAVEDERSNVKHLINRLTVNSRVTEQVFFVLDVNAFCSINSGYLIGEVALVCFSLKDGIKEYYHELINPGEIPMGFASDVKHGCKEFGLEMPDETANVTDFKNTEMQIENLLRTYSMEPNVLPPIFTVADKVDQVSNLLFLLSINSGMQFEDFKIYKLDFMFYTLINSLKSSRYEGFPEESLATVILNKDPFSYSPGIACDHHDALDKTNVCCKSRAFRWCYTVLDRCCPVAGVDMLPGKHLPPGMDLDAVLTYREEKEIRKPPTIAGLQASSSCNSTLSGVAYAYDHAQRSGEGHERTHTPLRMPKVRPSQNIRIAPVFDEADPLGSQNSIASTSRGRGRGRLVNQLGNLNLGK